MTSDPNAVRYAQFAEVQQHLTRMTAYATGRASIRLDDGVIENVVKLTNKPADQLTEEDQRLLWATLDALTRKVQPATPASIRIGLDYESNGQRRPDGSRPSNYARRGIRNAMLWLACSMVLAFLLQMYVAWGLSIVRNILWEMRGRVTFESAQGKGTRVLLELPIARPESKQSREQTTHA